MGNLKPLKNVGGGQPPQDPQRPVQPPVPQQPQRPPVDATEKPPAWSPPPIRNIEDTGLPKLNLVDLVLKVLYFRGDMVGHQIGDVIRLPFAGVIDQIIEFLKREKLVEIAAGSGGLGEASYR